MNNLEAYKLVLEYVQICTKSLDSELFRKIVAKDVALTRTIDRQASISATGIDSVVYFLAQYIFSSACNIQVNKINMVPGLGKITLYLKVTENKAEDNKVNQYVFEETSVFEFKQNETYQISRIVTAIKRTLI